MSSSGDTLYFDSIDELRTFAARPSPANRDLYTSFNSNTSINTQSQGRRAWFGVDSYSEVQALFNNGWPDGVAQMVKAMHDIEPPKQATSIKRRKTRGDSGDEFDWQAAAQGMNDIAWTRPVQRKIAAPRTVTLFCDLMQGSTYKTDAEQFFWRGATVLCLADSLSRAGYNVRIIAASRQVLDTERAPMRQFNVQVKRSDMPVDLNALASALCLAAFTRTVIFSAICASEPYPLSQSLCFARDAVSEPGEFPVYAHDKTSARLAVQQTLAAIDAS